MQVTRRLQVLTLGREKSEGARELVHDWFKLLLQILTAGPLDAVVAMQIEMHGRARTTQRLLRDRIREGVGQKN